MNTINEQSKNDFEPNKGRLVVEFEPNNSVKFSIQVDGVHPLQMLALSEWLNYESKKMFQREEYKEIMRQQEEMQKRQEQPKIVVPKPNFAPPGR